MAFQGTWCSFGRLLELQEDRGASDFSGGCGGAYRPARQQWGRLSVALFCFPSRSSLPELMLGHRQVELAGTGVLPPAWGEAAVDT